MGDEMLDLRFDHGVAAGRELRERVEALLVRVGDAKRRLRDLDGALKEREAETASTELAAAMQRIGELSMENELLRTRIGRPGPLGRRTSR